MNKKLRSKKGFTGLDVAIAIVILGIFITLISTIFINIYLQFSETQRNAVATSYATMISELVDKMYYQDVENASLQEKIEELNINNGYTVTTDVRRYIPDGFTENNSKNLVKIVNITVRYNVGNISKAVSIQKLKAKEVLITPNKPKLSSGMVPVKYVVTDVISQTGYWQITTEDDATWYSYENKSWANIMLQDGLTVEGNIEVTDQNMVSLVGKKVVSPGSILTWIPRYAYNNTTNDVLFTYSTSDKFVNNNGDLQNLSTGYSIDNVFQGNTGFWITRTNANSINYQSNSIVTVRQMANSEKDIVKKLSQSKYEDNTQEWNNINDSRFVIVISQ